MIYQSGSAKSRFSVWLLLFGWLAFSGCSDGKKTAQTGETTLSKPAATQEDDMQPPAAFKNERVSANGTNETWQYTKTADKEGRTVYKAAITSPKLLEFDFPYNGGSVATLTIRKRDDATHVYIQVSKGQFNRSYQEGNARVRFDGSSPVTYTFSAAENGSANIVFFNSEQALINRIKASRNMLIDIDFAGQGRRQIEFRTAGLAWDH